MTVPIRCRPLQPQTSSHTDWRIGSVRQTGFTQMPKVLGSVVIREESNSHLVEPSPSCPPALLTALASLVSLTARSATFRQDDTALPYASSFRPAMIDE